MVSIDSWRAASMKAQVFTTTRSASSGPAAGSSPSASRDATTLSESTAFFGQPSVSTKKRWILGPLIAPQDSCGSVHAARARPCPRSVQAACAGHLGPAERTLDQEHQRLLHVEAVARVAQHDRDVGRHRQRLAHLARVVAVDAVEQVDRDHERDAEVLEVVDRREAVLDAAGVDEHDAADRAAHQLVPEEQEAVLARACRTCRAPCRGRG